MNKEVKCSNKIKCTCENLKCTRHGKCCECIAKHKKLGKPPMCLRKSVE